MSNSFYPHKSIKTIEELANILSEDQQQLIEISNDANRYYKPNPQLKPNGTTRMTYIVLQPLKRIQNKIKNRILDKAIYAEYLFYGIKGKDGVKANAIFHCKHNHPTVLMALDIKQFYPSITLMHIKNIWLTFFKFSESVSDVLTKLTAFLNELPQGSSTSVHLSNLVFCKNERKVVKNLKQYQATYSRYADDIAITLHNPYSKKKLSKIMSLVISFLGANGFKLNRNREKFNISPQTKAMVINKTGCVNNNNLSCSNHKRKKARAMVHQYEKHCYQDPKDTTLKNEYSKIMGFLFHCRNIKAHKDINTLIGHMKMLKPH